MPYGYLFVIFSAFKFLFYTCQTHLLAGVGSVPGIPTLRKLRYFFNYSKSSAKKSTAI